MLNLIIFYMGFMNVVLVLSVMLSGLKEITPEQQAICSVALNTAIFVYSFLLSHIISYCCEKWKRHLSATWRKVGLYIKYLKFFKLLFVQNFIYELILTSFFFNYF